MLCFALLCYDMLCCAMLCAKLSQEVCVNLDTVTEKNAHRIKPRQNYHAPSAPSRNLNRARILQPLGTAPKVELALSETSACICACTGLLTTGIEWSVPADLGRVRFSGVMLGNAFRACCTDCEKLTFAALPISWNAFASAAVCNCLVPVKLWDEDDREPFSAIRPW